MRKPFSIEELIVRIKRLVKTSPSSNNNKKKITIGEYEYNRDTYQLIYKEEVTTLSPRSGEILYRLSTAKDHILPRNETLTDLWGDDNFFNGRSLDVFISKLRRQLSRDPRISIINIRATGYRLVIAS